jgi:uncharacterized protein YndB with AHSA1/START domain
VVGPEGDVARVSVFVRVAPDVAFSVFTTETDLWWGKGPKYRRAGKRPGQIGFECGPGGRLFETVELSAGPRTFEVGRILSWEPPSRFSFEWRGANFKPHEKTLVEVTFEPSKDGTLVTVRHSGFAALPDDHPVRHGQRGRDFSRMMGLWWGELMTSLRAHALERDR